MKFKRFIKFCIVGFINNVVYFAVYYLCIFLNCHYMIANALGFSLSVLNAFVFNNKWVFKDRSDGRWWLQLIKTYASYGITGIGLNSLLLFLWVNAFGVSTTIAPIINVPITMTVNYLLNKKWVFNKNESLKGGDEIEA